MRRLPLLALLALVAAAPKVIDDDLAVKGQDVSDFPRPAGLTLKSYKEEKGAKRVEETATYHSAAATDAVLAEYRRLLIGRGWSAGAHSDSGKDFHRVVMTDWKTPARGADLRLYTDRAGGTDVWVRVNTDPAAKSAAAEKDAVPATNMAVVVVPSVVGKPTKDAEWSLQGDGFAVTWAQPVVQPAGRNDTADKIHAQNPAAGARAARGSAVTLTATKFMATVPNVAGLPRARAEEALRTAHLVLKAGPDQPTTERNKAGGAASSQPAVREHVPIDSDVTVSFYQLAGPVPALVGRTMVDAKAVLQGPPGGPRFTAVEAPPQAVTDPSQRAGYVAAQDPAAGTVAMDGATVTLTPWDRNVRAPNLVGKAYVAPGTQLGQAGPGVNFEIRVGASKPNADPRLARTVAEQSPAAGQPMANGGTITITVWTLAGPVPNVVGKTYADAAQTLRSGPGGVPKFSAKPGLSGTTNDRTEAQRVYAQDPAAGTVAQDGSTVTLLQKALVQRLLNVVGDPLQSARRQLEQMGYQVQVLPPRPTNDLAKDGTVATQSPAADTHLPSGETVTLTAYSLHPPQ